MARLETVYTDEDLVLWRHKNRLTMAEAANLLGVSRQTVFTWERGSYPRDLFAKITAAETLRAANAQAGHVLPSQERLSQAGQRDLARKIKAFRIVEDAKIIATFKEEHERWKDDWYASRCPDNMLASEPKKPPASERLEMINRAIVERFGVDPADY